MQSVRARLLAVYVGLVVIGFGGLTLWAGQQMASTTRDDFATNLQVHALLLANQLQEPLEDNPNQAMRIIQDSATNLNAQVDLFTPAGQLIATSGTEAIARIPTNTYQLIDGLIVTSAAVGADDEIEGIVQLAASTDIPNSSINQRWLGLAAGFIGFTSISLVVTLWLLNSLTSPLSQLRDTALAMAQGDLTRRVEALPQDEIGTVGQAFNTMAEQVEAMVQEQRTFASNASHELRTPLTTIRLRTEGLLNGHLDDETAEQYIREIDSEIQQMGHLVEDLMLLSRLDANRLQAGSEQIDFAQLTHNELRSFHAQAVEKQITITAAKIEQPLYVIAHSGHLRVVCRNIIDNAIKYTPEGGNVTVTLVRDGAFARFQITDSGQGISADDLPEIGNRFFRADKAHSREIHGTGLGLALVESIVSLYNGRFEITSLGIGQGTKAVVHWVCVDSFVEDSSSQV